MTKYLRISSYIRKPFLIYDFAPDALVLLYVNLLQDTHGKVKKGVTKIW
jgi:hypothetical protein